MNIELNQDRIDRLRVRIAEEMSDKRYRHTLGVEQMAIRLSDLYCPEKKEILQTAALLHDITKELSYEDQLELLKNYGIALSATDLAAPKTFHARTAAQVIAERFPEYADPEIISCVRWHTTGRAGMTLAEKIVYLADYIEETRTFCDCVTLRRFFFDAEPDALDRNARLKLLRKTLILSYDMTIRGLLEEGIPISEDTVQARNDLIVS